MLQAMTAPENCASAPSSDGRETPAFVSHQGYDEGAAGPWGQYDPPFWGPPEAWWGYYPPPPPLEGQQGPPPPYWDPYSAMYAYAAYGYPPYAYPPHPHPHFASPRPFRYPRGGGSDSDECSGYSSTDEMAYYGANFAARRFAPPAVQPQQDSTPTPTAATVRETEEHSAQNSGSDEETSDSDTEVEDERGGDESGGGGNSSSGGLQMIRSVSDINVYSGSTGNANSHSSDTNDDEETEREDDDSEEEEDDEEPEEVIVYNDEQPSLPHQLSVIYEEGEQSDADSVRQKTSAVTSDNNGDDDSDADYDAADPGSSTVTVRLPLKLKFSRSENDEEVTTLIVGDSQVDRTADADARQDGKRTDVSVTVRLSPRPYPCGKLGAKSPTPLSLPHQMSASDLDAYETAESDSDVSVCLSIPLKGGGSRKNSPTAMNGSSAKATADGKAEDDEEEDVKVKSEESDSAISHWEDDSSSTSVRTVKLAAAKGERQAPGKEDTAAETQPLSAQASDGQEDEEEEDEDSTSEEESSDSEDSSRSYISSKEAEGKGKKDGGNAAKAAPQDEEDSSEESDDSDYENNASVDDAAEQGASKEDEAKVERKTTDQKVCAAVAAVGKESGTGPGQRKEKGQGKETLRRNSSKSQEESEEDDSGVTSDLSRPISDADTESETNQSELQLLTKCQRAATHSRLFKLLQDECGKDDDDQEDHDEQEEQDLGALKDRKTRLTLPLNQNSPSDPDSLSSSSGFASPASPTVTDRLVNELVRSLLQRKKGKKFKKLPMAKLQAAALRILQEDMDPYDTVSSAGSEDSNGFYLSPVYAQHSTAGADPYGANYYDYCDYYDSWGSYPSYEYDVVPSRAFKLLQEHAQPNGFSSGVISGLWGKCPRVPSARNPPPPPPEDPPAVVASAQAS